jgi:BON domain-containing protein
MIRPEQMHEKYLAARLRAEIGLDPRGHELGIHVHVVFVEHCVVLDGLVATAERRDRIEGLARELLPDFEVRNDIAVQYMLEPKCERLA